MYAEVAWVLVSSGIQVQPQVILDPDYFPDYLSISYDYTLNKKKLISATNFGSCEILSQNFLIVCNARNPKFAKFLK